MGLSAMEKELLFAPTCAPPCVSLPATTRLRDVDVPGGALKKADIDDSDAIPTSASERGAESTGDTAEMLNEVRDPEEGRKE